MELAFYESCVYCIYTQNGVPLYVGSTNNLKKRFNDHAGNLARGTHGNNQLQHYVHVNGIDCLVMVPVFYCREADRYLNEMRFINFIRPAFNNSWNGGLKIGVEDTMTKDIIRHFKGQFVPFDIIHTWALENGYPKVSAKAVGSRLKGIARVRVRTEGNRLYYQF